MKKYTIWTSDIDVEDWSDFLEECYPDVTDEYDQYILCADLNNEYLDDERMNLDIQLSDSILAIADLGFWNGRAMGYKEIHSGNIADCLYSDCDYATWYLDELGDFRMDGTHHDGRNYVLYRVWKDGISSEQKENLLWKIYQGKATRKDITRYTRRIGDEIAAVYGWKIRKAKKIA